MMLEPDPVSGLTKGGSLLVLCAYYASLSSMRRLLPYTAIMDQLDKFDKKGLNAIAYAAVSPYIGADKIIRLLRMHGARTDLVQPIENGKTPAQLAANAGFASRVPIITEPLTGPTGTQVAVDVAYDSDEETDLSKAMETTGEQDRLVKWVDNLLAEHLADEAKLTQQDAVSGMNKACSILMLCAHHCAAAALRTLLTRARAHVDVNIRDNKGMAALMYAAQSSHPHGLACVGILLEMGARTDLTNSRNQTAIDLAVIWDHHDRAALMHAVAGIAATAAPATAPAAAAPTDDGATLIAAASTEMFAAESPERIAARVEQLLGDGALASQYDYIEGTTNAGALMSELCYAGDAAHMARLLAGCEAARALPPADARDRHAGHYAVIALARGVPGAAECIKMLHQHWRGAADGAMRAEAVRRGVDEAVEALLARFARTPQTVHPLV